MSLENLISFELSDPDWQAIDDALAIIEGKLAGKVINLEPEERSRHGRISNKTENWVQKVKNYMDLNPTWVPAYIDQAEHGKDLGSRAKIMPRLIRLASISEGLDDTNLLISSDIWHNSIAFYRNLKISAQQNVPGTTSAYNDLKTQFPGRPNSGGGNP